MTPLRLRHRLLRFLLCLLGGLIHADAGAETLTIATYNVENYVPANRMTEAGYRRDYPKPEVEKQALRAVIRGLNADVLILQEMGPRPYLDELQRDLRTVGIDYPLAELALAADPDRHIAILSRRPLHGVKTHNPIEFSYFGMKETVKRGLLEATLSTPAGEITLFAVHLKSRYTDRPDDPGSAIRRGGEATAIRDVVLRRFPVSSNARFLILGDCNDVKTSRAMAYLQKRGKTEIALVLPAADSRDEVWTHFYRREDSYSRVDFMLVSAGLLPLVQDRKAHIYDGAGVSAASDHRPVFAVLRISGAPGDGN
jgi:endonuclease/exonuclease/phosphatase family metal-dependent hydrolase